MNETVKVLEPRMSPRPLVASIPHGSTEIPERFGSLLTVDPDRLWVDAFTPDLYAFLGDLGAVTVQAGLSRFVADPNLHSFGQSSHSRRAEQVRGADVILGDGRGVTARPSVVDLVENSLSEQGFSVLRCCLSLASSSSTWSAPGL
jgi:N-formylglutamate amidohydrolase